jgi:hypothetical protein
MVKMAPKTATPMATPTSRKELLVLVAVPIWSAGTEFCTTRKLWP